MAVEHQWWCGGKEPCACTYGWKQWQKSLQKTKNMTDDQILKVVRAHKEGKKIERVGRFEADKDINWRHDPNPKWNFEHLIYRVAFEPRKPREWILPASMLDTAKMIEGVIHSGEPEITVREVLE